MDVKGLSITFITKKIKECKEFYQKYFNGKVTFDSEWYFTIMFFLVIAKQSSHL
jgi:hypothetical protein